MKTQKLMAGVFGLVLGGLSLQAGAATMVETSREVIVTEIKSLGDVNFSCRPGVAVDKPYPTPSHLSISLGVLIQPTNIFHLSSLGPDVVMPQLGDHCDELAAAIEKQLPAQAVVTQVFSEGCDTLYARPTKVFIETIELVVGNTVFSESKRTFGGRCPR